MGLVSFIFYLSLCAVILVFLEIQIEGKHGWAGKLPCFKTKKKIFGEKPITGYHIFILIFTLLIFHLPVFFSDWSFKKEMLIIGSWIFVWSLEDFLWFIFNPHYGLSKFNKANKEIWWHKSWFLGLPSFYWLAFPASLILVVLGW